jgi:hypothetical protein
MLLILTNSYDATTDLLIPRLSQVPVFRLNTDLFSEYEFSISDSGWVFRDCLGREASSCNVAAAYWRKPYAEPFGLRCNASDYEYCHSELKYAFDAVVADLFLRKRFALVEPHAERRLTKIAQLNIASGFFPVPKWVFGYNVCPNNHPLRRRRAICKSLSGRQVNEDSVMYTSEVKPTHLDQTCPWFTQVLIEGMTDVTVAYVDEEMWALEQNIEQMGLIVDWRASRENNWHRCDLSGDIKLAIDSFMKSAQLEYGRIDFV